MYFFCAQNHMYVVDSGNIQYFSTYDIIFIRTEPSFFIDIGDIIKYRNMYWMPIWGLQHQLEANLNTFYLFQVLHFDVEACALFFVMYIRCEISNSDIIWFYPVLFQLHVCFYLTPYISEITHKVMVCIDISLSDFSQPCFCGANKPKCHTNFVKPVQLIKLIKR